MNGNVLGPFGYHSLFQSLTPGQSLNKVQRNAALGAKGKMKARMATYFIQ